jgi:hypothetical protein
MVEQVETITIDSDGVTVYKKLGKKKVSGRRTQKIISQKKISGAELLTLSKPNSDILPIGTRFWETRENRTVFVVEEPPRVRTLFWSEYYVKSLRQRHAENKVEKLGNMKVKRTFQLAFPYIVYFVIFDKQSYAGLCVFYRTAPLMSLKDFLCRANLPNMSGGEVCTGSGLDRNSEFKSTDTYSRQVRQIIKSFWNSEFNSDLRDSFNHYMFKGEGRNPVEEFKTLWTWEKASQENPLFPLNVCWTGLGRNIGDKLNSIFNGRNPNCFPSEQEKLFGFLKKRVSRIRPIDTKTKKPEKYIEHEVYYDADGVITGFTEHGETFSIGDILVVHGVERKIAAFRNCAYTHSDRGCSPGRKCPYIILDNSDGTCCPFDGHNLKSGYGRL